MRLDEAELPTLNLKQPNMHGDQFHRALSEARAQSWIVRTDSGVAVLEREAAEFFLKSPALAFPGAELMELMGITEGAIHRVMKRGLLGRSGDDHKRLRRLVSRSFTPRAADHWRPVMSDLLAELWDEMGGTDRCEAMNAIARPFPSRMIAVNVGAPIADAPLLREYSAILQARLDVEALLTRRQEIEDGTAAFESYVEDLVQDHVVKPREDLVSELLRVEEDGDRLAQADVVSLVIAMLSGGIDTTENQLAHGLRLFAEHPDQWRALGDDPSMAKAAADEVLRFEPVGPFTVRIVRDAFTYRDIVFPVGSVVPVCTWTANREAPGDDAPMVFDITAPRGKIVPLASVPGLTIASAPAWPGRNSRKPSRSLRRGCETCASTVRSSGAARSGSTTSNPYRWHSRRVAESLLSDEFDGGVVARRTGERWVGCHQERTDPITQGPTLSQRTAR